MLVSSGDKIILARKKGWPEDRYSTLAGFVEQKHQLTPWVKFFSIDHFGWKVSGEMLQSPRYVALLEELSYPREE